MRIKTPSDAIDAGLVLVPEDRKAQGVVLAHTIASNLALGNFDRSARAMALSFRAMFRPLPWTLSSVLV